MTQKQIAIIVVLFLFLIGGMFLFAYLKKTEIQINEEPVTSSVEESNAALVERINAKHFFIDGTHTLAGTISLPTPCDLLNWDVFVAESYPEQVTVDFSVLNTAESCAAVVTDQRFLVSFDASEDAMITARFMGDLVELNLIPAAPGETPESFELFIKG